MSSDRPVVRARSSNRSSLHGRGSRSVSPGRSANHSPSSSAMTTAIAAAAAGAAAAAASAGGGVGSAGGASRVAAEASRNTPSTKESTARGRWGRLKAGGSSAASEKMSRGGTGAGSGGGGSSGSGGGGSRIESSKTTHAGAAAAGADAGARDRAASASGSEVSVQWASGEVGEHAGKASGEEAALDDQDVGSEAGKLAGGAQKREQQQQQQEGILSRVKSMQHRAGRTQVNKYQFVFVVSDSEGAVPVGENTGEGMLAGILLRYNCSGRNDFAGRL